MTPEEAKEFYFQYLGFSFHMDREEPVKYSLFKQLNPGKDILRKWDEELLESLYDGLWQDPARIWVSHGNILRIISRNNCDSNQYLGRLLQEMEKMEHLDLFPMTLIIENMAGRTGPLKDGGVYIFCKYSGLAAQMNAVTERLIAACSKAHDTDERFEKAVSRYRKAFRKWAAAG